MREILELTKGVEWLSLFLDWDWDNQNYQSFILPNTISKSSEIKSVPHQNVMTILQRIRKKYRINLKTLKTPNNKINIEEKEWRWNLTIPYEDSEDPHHGIVSR